MFTKITSFLKKIILKLNVFRKWKYCYLYLLYKMI